MKWLAAALDDEDSGFVDVAFDEAVDRESGDAGVVVFDLDFGIECFFVHSFFY
jgi:hypothetical protein